MIKYTMQLSFLTTLFFLSLIGVPTDQSSHAKSDQYEKTQKDIKDFEILNDIEKMIPNIYECSVSCSTPTSRAQLAIQIIVATGLHIYGIIRNKIKSPEKETPMSQNPPGITEITEDLIKKTNKKIIKLAKLQN